jgi:hypothetical protein
VVLGCFFSSPSGLNLPSTALRVRVTAFGGGRGVPLLLLMRAILFRTSDRASKTCSQRYVRDHAITCRPALASRFYFRCAFSGATHGNPWAHLARIKEPIESDFDSAGTEQTIPQRGIAVQTSTGLAHLYSGSKSLIIHTPVDNLGTATPSPGSDVSRCNWVSTRVPGVIIALQVSLRRMSLHRVDSCEPQVGLILRGPQEPAQFAVMKAREVVGHTVVRRDAAEYDHLPSFVL